MIIPRGGFFYNPSDLSTRSVPGNNQNSIGYPIQDPVHSSYTPERPLLTISYNEFYQKPYRQFASAVFAPRPVSYSSYSTMAFVNKHLTSAGFPVIQEGDVAYAVRGSLRPDAVLHQMSFNVQPGTRIQVLRIIRDTTIAHAQSLNLESGKSNIFAFNPNHGVPNDMHVSVYVIVIRACGFFSCNVPKKMHRPVKFVSSHTHYPNGTHTHTYTGAPAPTMSNMPGSYLYAGSPALSMAW